MGADLCRSSPMSAPVLCCERSAESGPGGDVGQIVDNLLSRLTSIYMGGWCVCFFVCLFVCSFVRLFVCLFV